MLHFDGDTMLRQWFILCFATVLGFAVTACGGATGQSARVAVISIEGNDSANALVQQAVNNRYDLVTSKRYNRAARKLKAKSLESKDVRKVSRKLDIQALVDGEFLKKGKKKYELRLTFRAGDSGKEFESVVIKLKSKKISGKDRKRIKRELYAALSDVDSWVVASPNNDSDRRGSRVSAASGREERERARRMRGKNHDRARDREDRRDKRDRDKDRRKRDDDDDDDRRSSKSKKNKSKKKKSKKKKRKDRDRDRDRDREDDDDFDVSTERDSAGQALDEESPF